MNWYIVLSLLPFLRPDWMPNYSDAFSKGILVWELISILSLIVLYIKNRKKIHPIVWAIGVLELWILISTLIHGQYTMAALLYLAVPSGFVVLVMNYYIDDPQTLVSSVMLDFEVYVYIEVFTILYFKETGMGHEHYYGHLIYFLGQKNQFISYCYPSFALALLFAGQCRNKWWVLRSGCLMAACLFVVFKLFSATTVVGVCVMLALFVVFLIPKCREILSFPILYLLTLIAHFLIVEYRITAKVPLVSRFITDVLHKDPTLTSRFYLWDDFHARMDSVEKWLTGLGYEPLGEVFFYNADGTPSQQNYTHNEYYEMLAQGGVVQLALLLVVIGMTGKKLFDTRGSYTSAVLTAVTIGLCCSWLCEIPVPMIWTVFVLGYFADILESTMVAWNDKTLGSSTEQNMLVQD